MEPVGEIKRQVSDFVKSHSVGVLATYSPNGEPEASTLLYLSDDDLNIHFVTRRSSRKFKNLSVNKNVAFVIGTEPASTTLQINGEVELLSGEEQLGNFIEKLSKNVNIQNLYYGPFLKLQGMDFAVFKLKPKWARYLHLNLGTMSEEYHSLEL